MKKLIYIFIILAQLSVAYAQGFVVKHIEIEGLEGVSTETVKSYLPIKVGQTLQPGQTDQIVRALYKSGFFEHISLSRENNTLIIHVVPRPTIGQLKIKGNSVIPTDKLNMVLKSLDISEGHVYNPAVLERIKQSLLNEYYRLGRYAARVDITTTPMSRNRVAVNIDISEGLVAKIERISIIGNHAFPEKTLVKQLPITTTGLFTFVTQNDRYSEARLDESLEKLRSYYMDHGYIRFQVKSAQGEVTPDRKSVYVTIVVDEGEQYTITGYDIRGHLIFPRSEYEKRVKFKVGEIFSRQKVVDTEKAFTDFLGDKGYMFAGIALRPEINDKNHTVNVIFDINPGKRAYVHHITFSDNTRTNDVVLRREIQQMEAAPVSTSKLDDSKHRMLMLPYIKDVEMSVNPVEEGSDQVDVNYKVKEDSSAAEASFKIGYSQMYHMILGAGLNQKNFLGTGNTLGLNFQRSKYEQYYGIDYTDPYYTADGISRTYNFSVSKVDPGEVAKVNNGYTSSEYNLGVLYGIPISQERGVVNTIQAGVSYQNTLINVLSGKASNQVNTFVNNHGRHFQELDLKLGYYRNSFDKAIFPTSGDLQTLYLDTYVPVAQKSLTFYTLNYHGKWYFPLTDQFIFTTRGDLGYGNGFHGVGDFPFFKNYYAGGIDSVRGYLGYGLGPRDSKGLAYGGNELIDGSIALIFPNYLSDNLRTSVFIDAGNVYSTANNRSFGGQSTNSGPLRYSAGVEADLLTPFGPIALSLAEPIHSQPHDRREVFQLSLGANF